MKTITITVSKIALITKKSEHKPSVVCVIFMSGHKSIKYVFITLRLESFENENYRSEVYSFVVCERQVCSSMAQVMQHDCLITYTADNGTVYKTLMGK